ncbi:hypothetical protein [Kitasatospora sp. NPDC057738]|uniref:hypothetical protein n=1 Tax=Kitasatospora sp. NPDC057738 TaxID=3346233 RepID=UPI00367962F6
MCRQSGTVCLTKSLALDSVAGLSLLERWRVLRDLRRRRGLCHPFVAVLPVAASAPGSWARSGVLFAPSTTPIRRVVALVCPASWPT